MAKNKQIYKKKLENKHKRTQRNEKKGSRGSKQQPTDNT